MKKLFFYLIFTILLISLVSSLGVTPARNPINFESNKKVDGKFTILNTNSQSTELLVKVQGDLKDYITLNQRRIQLSIGEEKKDVTYTLNLPSTLEPGVHIGEIVISEPTPEINDENTIVGATLSVITQVYVTVPFPGKYVDAQLNIQSSKKGEEVKFNIPIINKGEFNIESIHANIDVYTELNEKIDSFNTNKLKVESGKRIELSSSWKKDVPVGNYKAIATIIYDGESKTVEDTFKVGDELLELQAITVNNFQLGQIAKMELLVENKWSKPIQKVHTQVQIFNDAGNVLADFKSPDATIDALSKKILSSFWDTAGVNTGIYNTKVILHYEGGELIDTDLQLEVEENRLNVIGLGYVLNEEGDSNFETSDNLIMILIIIIGILILVNLVWFIILRRMLKKKNKK